MTRRPPLLLLIPIVYVVVVLASRVLVFGMFVLDAETVTLMVVVPAVQAAVLAGARRLWYRARRAE